MLHVALVGFGFAGSVFHAPVISAVEGLRLAAIVRRNGEPVERYPDAHVIRTMDELLHLPVDLVVICTPNQTHFPLTKRCLEAGRHVVVDKPFTTTFAEAEELIGLADARRRILSVYHNRRYVGDFQTVRALIEERAMGSVVSYEAHFDRFRPELKQNAWREEAGPGSGVWFDLGPHLLDQALVLFGAPEAITADIRIERSGARTDDAFDVMLRYPTMRAHLRASVLRAAPGPTFAVHGTGGSYVKYGLDPQEEALKAGRTPTEADWDAEPENSYGLLTNAAGVKRIRTVRSSFVRYYENVRDVILGRAQLEVTPAQALNAMRGLELAVESSFSRCAVPWH
jgi:scyllo-inositol 2-dehydrogenase (NADP+)